MSCLGANNQPVVQLGRRVSHSSPLSAATLSHSRPRCHAAATKLSLAPVTPCDSIRPEPPAAGHTSSSSRSRSRHHKSNTAHGLDTYDDSYDTAAVPMSSGWDRVKNDLGIGLDEGPPDTDPQEWEEMVSLLSFDGEEHKRVTRQMHGANTRVEDMFASFDGDDFEAVHRAARDELPSEPPGAPAAAAAQAQAQQQHGAKQHSAQQEGAGGAASASATDSSSGSLFQSVCAVRAAAMAAEAAQRQGTAPRRRRAPALEDWMLQVPYAVAGQQQTGQQAGQQGSTSPAAADGADRQQELSTGEVHFEPLPYIGHSCDSSSDGGCHSESGVGSDHLAALLLNKTLLSAQVLSSPAASSAAAATAAAAAGDSRAGGQQMQAATTASNNIVSSRALHKKLAPTAVMAVAGLRTAPAPAAAGGSTQAQAPPLASAAAAAEATAAAEGVEKLSLHTARSAPAAAVESPAAQVTNTSARLLLPEEAETAVTAGQDGSMRRWNGRNTRRLRCAIARLHKHKCEGSAKC